jgi:predicted RNA-binding protein with PUA-like domain
MRYWLMKSEPTDVSVDDLAALPNQTVAWYGIAIIKRAISCATR